MPSILMIILIASAQPKPVTYLDPNMGGLLYQILIVSLTSILGVLIIFSRKVRTFFRNLINSIKKPSQREDEHDQNDTPGA